jgi:chemotaxis protein CheD
VRAPSRFAPICAGSPDVTSERQVIEIFLAPGDLYFGDQDTRIRTVLGSCVAVTLWHPVRLIGGMCHYMLPTRGLKRGRELDGRYGDEAIQLFLDEVRRHRSHPAEYEVKVFGGGNMFPAERRDRALDVGRRNLDLGLQLLAQHRFNLKARHMAGIGHRSVVFEIWSGDVWMKHVETVSRD